MLHADFHTSWCRLLPAWGILSVANNLKMFVGLSSQEIADIDPVLRIRL